MDAKEFETRMSDLLPGADPAAMQNYLTHVRDLDREDTHPAEDNFDSMYVEFSLVKKHDGEDIARRLFNAGRNFTWNFFEIRGAAGFLKEGTAMEQIFENARDGLCDPTQEETQEYEDALNALRKTCDGQRESSPGRHDTILIPQDINGQGAADFAETMTNREAREEAQGNAPEPMSAHMPY